MDNAMTRGQSRALAAVAAMVAGSVPHAVLLTGPASSGKTTLAEDLAAALLCSDADPSARPCRRCRGCRLMASGNHPDVHRLAPDGAGQQIRIGDHSKPEPGTIRGLISDLALLAMEGGARVAIVEQAHRMNDDAQNALLKMLEEPPGGVTIILCADDEECLLPTVRSRCVRVRLGSVPGRDIEEWLAELGVADAPSAARFARLAAGSPGLALAYARAPEASRLRGEIARGLLDMLAAPRHERLTTVRALMTTAAALESALGEGRAAGAVAGDPESGPVEEPATPTRERRRRKAPPPSDGGPTADTATVKITASDRRAAAFSLLAIWASVARDLAVARLGAHRRLRDTDLLDEMAAVAPTLDPAAIPAFLIRLGAVEASLDDNVSPELALDVLSLAWPRPGHRPAAVS
jgi:DNA polymerase-3 subunit delta'